MNLQWEALKRGIVAEIERLIPVLMVQLTDGLRSEIQIEKIVSDKVNNFSSDKLEQILMSIMSKEFRFVEIIGAVLGFIIGWIQLLLLKLS
jgi:uncharacterized membrane protein YheB (UPF0754 family)